MQRFALPFAMVLLGAVSARAQDDHVSSRSTSATPITVDGALVSGRIEVAGDRDWFRTSLTAGRTYSVSTSSLAAGMDSVISVYTPSNSLVGTDDNGGGGLSSRLTFVAASTGNFYVRLVHKSTVGTGTYSIGVVSGSGTTPLPTLPSAPTGLVATALGTTRVDLAWTDASTNETSFAVERRRLGSSSYTAIGSVGANVTGFSDTTATEGRTFEYRVFAANAAGRRGSVMAAATTWPAAPLNVVATARSHTNVDVTWTDASGGETGYRVERRAPGGAFSSLGTAAANAIVFADDSLNEGANVEYRVIAWNASGQSASAVASVTTPPAPPTDLVATRAGTSRMDLTWTDASAHESGYRIERRTWGTSGPITTVTTLPAGATGYADSSVTVNAQYYYDVFAVGPGGESASGIGASMIVINHARQLIAQPAPPADVHLTWWDTSSNETGFRIERRVAGTTAFTVLATTPANATRWVDVSVATPGVYDYQVVATDGAVDALPSNSVRVTVNLPAPTNLTALALSPTEVRLSWIDNSATETGFSLERTPTGDVIATVGPDVTTFVDASVTAGGTYGYRVIARDALKASPRGDAVWVTLPTSPLTGPAVLPAAPSGLMARAAGPNTIELTWVDNATNDVRYRVERRHVMPSEFMAFGQREWLPANATTFTDTDVSAGLTYEYRVTAVGDAGHSLPSNLAGATPPVLDAPTDLASGVVTVRWVELSWTDTTTTETGFRIERAGRGSNQWFVVGRVAPDVTSFVDTTADSTGEYSYRVIAETIGGSSGAASQLEVNVPPAPPPVAASGLRAVATPFRVDLSWVDHATTESHYWIERRRGTDPFRIVGSTLADATTFVDATSDYGDAVVLPGRTYEYRVFAANEGGRAASSEVVAVTTPPGPALRNGDFETGDARGWTGPASEGQLAVARFDVDGDGVESWALRSGDRSSLARHQEVVLAGGDLDLRVNVAGSRADGSVFLLFDGVLVASVDFGAIGGDARHTLRASVAGVAPGTHEVRINVDGGSGERFVDDVALAGSAVPAAPTAPTTLGITAATTGRVDLAWADTSTNETGFRIERSPRGSGSFAEVGRTGADVVTFSDTTVGASAAYEYRVRATNESGHSPASNVALSALPLRPATPRTLMAWTTGPALVTLTWADRSAIERGFVIERRLQGGWFYSRLGVVQANVTTFHDIWAAPLVAYDYRVIAWNDAGESTPARVSATTFSPGAAPGAPTNLVATVAGSAGVRLTWTTGSGSDTGVRIRRDLGNGGWMIVGVAPAGATSFVDTTADPDVLRTYDVMRMSAGGDSPLARVTIATGPRAPAPASDLRVAARDPYRAQLTWTDAADDETGYRVERRPLGGATFAPVAALSANATSWLDQDLLPETSVEYRVVATRPTAEAPPSAPAAATTPPTASPQNGDFETRDLRGWTVFGPTTHAIQEMGLLDVDGDGRLSWAASFRRAGYSEQVGLRQEVNLVAGSLDLSVAAAVRQNNSSGGVLSLVFDGLVVAQFDFNGFGRPDGVILRASLPSVAAGRHEIRLMIERGMGSSDSTPRHWFDDLKLSGSAVATAPATPTSVTVTRLTTGVRVAWTDASTNERAFRIERSPPGGGSFVELGRAPAGVTSFTDTTATSTGGYDYRVFATNEGGDGAASEVAAVR